MLLIWKFAVIVGFVIVATAHFLEAIEKAKEVREHVSHVPLVAEVDPAPETKEEPLERLP